MITAHGLRVGFNRQSVDELIVDIKENGKCFTDHRMAIDCLVIVVVRSDEPPIHVMFEPEAAEWIVDKLPTDHHLAFSYHRQLARRRGVLYDFVQCLEN